MAAADQTILVAHVTVDDETMTVKHDEVHHALHSLGEQPRPGLHLVADIRYEAMTETAFAALPEWQ
ncbi:hypothetical protein ACPCHQ_21725 [Ralstonia thomasii]|uniref:hypothetical protein n=1 Tax=Ralstonia thomasii TaxID=3058596 RepID=UPI003C306604